MYRYILLAFIVTSSFALEISIDIAKENFQKYSILKIKDTTPFVCQAIKNDFDITTEVVCGFSKDPSQDIKSLQNDFFKVESFHKKGTFFVSIKPLYKMKLIADIFNLTQDDSVFSADVKISKAWSIIGYKKELPLLKSEDRSPLAINFPFFMQKDKMPFVGSLDLHGNPVHIKTVGDVKKYLKVKEYFRKKRYDDALDLIDEIISDYPNTLFKPELTYYKIKLFDKLKDYDSVISSAKIFLREYSSDENIPEVLSLMAKAYAKMSQTTDADYFFDRLFSEHKGNVFAQKGYIYKGEMLEDNGANKDAIKYYKKALYETKDLEVAASAAYHLSNILLLNAPKKSANYVMKIIDAKKSFFMEDIKQSMKLMSGLADAKEYKAAAAIADALLKSMGPGYDEYEDLLKDKALWLAKTDDKEAALKALNAYIKKFPDGDYIDAIDTAKDGLFFERKDLNATAKLAEYDNLMQDYAGDTIAKKALYEKAKLLLNLKEYAKILAMRKEIESLDESSYPDKESILTQAAMGEMEASLKEKNCKNVLVVSNEYNITLSNRWDEGIYNCAMMGGDFKLAKSIASKNLESKNIDERKAWLYRYAKIDFATGNYSECVDVAKDLVALIENPKTSKYKDIYRYLFDAYSRLGEKEGMIESMTKIEDIYGLDYQDIDRYVAMIGLATDLKDDKMVIKYGSKVMQIQKSSHSHAQSPYVEFTLYGAYMNLGKYQNALDVIASLNGVKLNKEDRARQKYLLGTVLSKLWRDSDAKRAYKEAIEADPTSAWAKLAKSALAL